MNEIIDPIVVEPQKAPRRNAKQRVRIGLALALLMLLLFLFWPFVKSFAIEWWSNLRDFTERLLTC